MKKKKMKRFKFFYEGNNEKLGKKIKPYKRKQGNKNLKEYLDEELL